MNSQSVIRKTIILTIKRAAFIVVATLLLTPLLHGQNAAADVPAAVSVSPDQQAAATSDTRDPKKRSYKSWLR